MNSLFQPIRAGLCFQIQLGKGPLRPVAVDLIRIGNCIRFTCINIVQK